MGRRYALVVGVDRYESREWPQLLRPSQDAKEIASELSTHYGFEILPVPENPTVEQFHEALAQAKEKAGENDDLLVFLAGHGHFDPTSATGYLILRDSPGPAKCPIGGCYPLSQVRTLLETSKARHVLVLVDACHGGTIMESIATRTRSFSSRAMLSEYSRLKSRLILTSGGNERVSDDSEFARQLLRTLRQPDETGLVTFEDMLGAVSKVPSKPKHGAMGRHDAGGTFILARNLTLKLRAEWANLKQDLALPDLDRATKKARLDRFLRAYRTSFPTEREFLEAQKARQELDKVDAADTAPVIASPVSPMIAPPREKNAFNSFDADEVQLSAKRFQECVAIEARKEHVAAADCFENFARRFPDDGQAPHAVYNAANNYFEARQVEKALSTQFALYKKFNMPKALYSRAEMYRLTLDFEQAAALFELFVENHPNHALAEQALRYASVFRKTLGHNNDAISNLQTYLKKFPTNQNAPRVDLDIILILAKQEKWPQVVSAVQAHIRKYPDEPPTVRLQALNNAGLALSKQRKARDAMQAFQTTVDTFNNLEERFKRDLDLAGMSAVAESHFNLGEIELQRARAIKLEGPTNKLIIQATREKLAILAKVKDTYERVIAYGHPGWVIAASTQLGLAYQDLADAIENAPMPAALRGFQEAEDQHRQHMADQSSQIRQTALVNYRRAVEVARDHRWFNDYSERAELAIAELDVEDTSVKEYRLRPIQARPNGGLPVFVRPGSLTPSSK